MSTENIAGPVEESFELYEHHNILVDEGQTPIRVDKFLFNKIVNVSRNKVQQTAKAGNILVNGKPVKSNYKVKPHDEISVVMTYPPRDVEILPEDIRGIIISARSYLGR